MLERLEVSAIRGLVFVGCQGDELALVTAGVHQSSMVGNGPLGMDSRGRPAGWIALAQGFQRTVNARQRK